MISYRRVARNVAFNWMGFAVQAAVAFFLTPYIIQQLGDARYGVWALTISLTGYYGLLDFGFRAGLTQHITRALAVKDVAQANRVVSSGLAALSICALLLTCASVGLAFSAPAFVQIPSDIANEVFWCIIIIGSSIAVQFVFFPFAAILTAMHRFDVSNAIGVGVRLLTALGTLIVLDGDAGLIELSIVTSAGNVLDYLLRLVCALRVLPSLRPSLRIAEAGINRTLFMFGLWSMVSLAGSRLISYSDALVVGAFMPLAAVAWFALAANLVNQFSGLFVPIGQVFFPLAAELNARSDAASLTAVYLRGTRILTTLVTASAVVAGMFATDFYRLWLGNRYATPGEYQPVPVIFQLLLIAASCSATQRIGCQILIACGRLKSLAGATACEAAMNLVLSLIMVQLFGLVGVAIGTLLPAIAFQLCIQPLMVCHQLHCSPLLVLRHVLPRATVTALVTIVLMQAILSLLNVNGWDDMALAAFLALIVSVAVFSFVGLTDSELRSMVATLMRPLRAPVGEGAALPVDTVGKTVDRDEGKSALTISL